MYNHRTTTSFVRSPDDPLSRKKLFDDTDFQTHKDRDGEFLFEQVEKSDVQADATGNYTVMEESDGQAEAAAKSDGLASKSDVDKHSSDPRANAPADSKMVEEINDCVQLCIEEMVQKAKPLTKKSVQQSIVLDDLPSPSVVAYDVADLSVIYKDHDKARARK
ncbi:hypothetical protein LWI29_032218 [Acer saccharum]|uniref:Uncharacterized protein n=1 Tax=Acer saccharum TaxID=4024 RepID=A0AA39VUR7_ACESA|nr:hypothetical protein LWI29_032218 [Acer saccharum]